MMESAVIYSFYGLPFSAPFSSGLGSQEQTRLCNEANLRCLVHCFAENGCEFVPSWIRQEIPYVSPRFSEKLLGNTIIFNV